MAVKTILCELLDIEYPILSAPMAAVGGGALAAAVSNAGGLGMIGGGNGDRDWLTRELACANNARVGAGFITWSLARQPELLDVVLDRSPAALMLSFGDFKPFIEQIKGTPAKLLVQVQTLEQAREAVASKVDAIVAQGAEAGGHGGKRATLPLVPAIVDIAEGIPVIAAGGIADGRGLAAALALGAAGVLCGTAFCGGEEALNHDNAKQAVVAGAGDNTVQSGVFDIVRGLEWPAEWQLRTLCNGFTERWSGDVDGLSRNLDAERERYEKARGAGNADGSAIIAGEGIDMVRAVEPAAAIVYRMAADAETCLRRAFDFLT